MRSVWRTLDHWKNGIRGVDEVDRARNLRWIAVDYVMNLENPHPMRPEIDVPDNAWLQQALHGMAQPREEPELTGTDVEWNADMLGRILRERMNQ